MFDRVFLEKEWMRLGCLWGASTSSVALRLSEVISRYNQKNRHYHTLDHIVHILSEADNCREYLDSWDAVFFAALLQKMRPYYKSALNCLLLDWKFIVFW